MGEIVAVHCLKEALNDNGVLNLERMKPALVLGADSYLTIAKESLRYLDRKIYGGDV